MNQALKKQERLVIPVRKEGDVAKARPCLGDHQAQLEKVRARSFARYENAYRELAKV
ncbi:MULTISPECIES: hypothetical protein [Halomonadaceae]|uniref:Uncharacterized protein n=1 Tax=Billgrantia aerodenitrificans TaxID=2733483 RepID=A0ABS9AZ03_9GAMM|nr:MULTISPECIES: hypothetical protein [Halomonas]MCE8026946.1 hypothetical protein [Halomonas aerodenitrificans]